jgi:hypothetical protein
MPSISVPEVLADFRAPNGNVALPGILTGFEPVFLLERIPSPWGLFVLEEAPANLKSALRLYDYCPWISAGRLVFILGPNPIDGLRRFFETNLGYDFPRTMVTVPQRTGAEMATLQGFLERAAGLVAEIQVGELQAIRKRLEISRLLPSSSSSDEPQPQPLRSRSGKAALAVVSTDASRDTLAAARRLERHLQLLDWRHAVCVPDSPSTTHTFARMQAVERASANFVIALNCWLGLLRTWLPSAVNAAAWFVTSLDARDPSKDSGLREIVFTACANYRHALINRGWPADDVVDCPMAADLEIVGLGETLRSRVPNRNPPGPFSPTIALLADLPDPSPEALGITLPSHLLLWKALIDTGPVPMEPPTDDISNRRLSNAERKSGVSIRDEKVREDFLTIIRTVLIPRLAAQAAAEAAGDSGWKVSLYGVNWPSIPGADIGSTTTPGDTHWRDLLQTVDAIGLPEISPRWVQYGVDALSAGVDVVCRASREEFVEEYPGLQELADFVLVYQCPDELTALLRRLRRENSAIRNARTDAVRRLIQSRHTWANRIRLIVQVLTERYASLECGPS